jgi:hypothetical protein
MISRSIQKKINVKTLFTCLLVLVFFNVSLYPADAGPEKTRGMFTDVPYSDAAPFLSAENQFDARVMRSRLVKVDFGQAGELLQVNLFHDVSFFARKDQSVTNRSGSVTWIGKSIDDTPGSVILTVKDNIMAGSVSIGNRNYVIRYIGGGIHEIQQMDQSKYAECKDPAHDNGLAIPDSGTIDLSAVQDDGSIIDVMVVYTATARSGAGGATAMQNLIDQAVSETNTGYNNSNVNPRVNLVHTAEIVYNETGFSWGQAINRLVGKNDGYMDNVHTLRNTYKADVVVMIVNNTAYCGLANTIMANESGAFCLVSRTCVTGYYSFAHEIGHLQGARHDRYVDPTENSPFAYNHGYTYPANNWRTIMAYNNACTAVGKNCTRVNYWSNPNVLYGGVAMGVFGGVGVGVDNHRCLNNTAYTVANFRESGGSATYCASAATNTEFAWISMVEFGDWYNSSGSSGYADYTSQTLNMTRGSTVNLALSAQFGGDVFNGYWRIWIDYNMDGDFEDGNELVFSGSGTGTVLGNFTVAAVDGVGATRMRIVMQHGSYRSSACGTFTFGEVEDYTVNLQ